MKNNVYRRLRKRLTLLFLFQTIILTGILLLVIAILSYRSSYEASIGNLKSSDFLMFYRNHGWEFNTFLFASGNALLLFLFIRSFFRCMRILLLRMQGEEIRHFPLLFRLLPEFREADAKVMEMMEKRKDSRDVSMQEREHKNQLLMYLAHDLKTPLTSMIGYINHILDHSMDTVEEDKAIHIANDKAKRLDDLIDEFSEILRYDDKLSQLDISRIELCTLIRQQVEGFYPLMEKKQITLQCELPKAAYILGDYDKLLRVFDNLMRNAITYAFVESTIQITMEIQDTQLVIMYRNMGEAMEEETISHLFDKFYRASSARTSTSGGAGLGLAIAREIIQLHHGTIHAAYQNPWITFTIHLPIDMEVKL